MTVFKGDNLSIQDMGLTSNLNHSLKTLGVLDDEVAEVHFTLRPVL